MREKSSKEGKEKARLASDAVMRVTYSLARTFEELQESAPVPHRRASSATSRPALGGPPPREDGK
jgi:hypothetical protein